MEPKKPFIYNPDEVKSEYPWILCSMLDVFVINGLLNSFPKYNNEQKKIISTTMIIDSIPMSLYTKQALGVTINPFKIKCEYGDFYSCNSGGRDPKKIVKKPNSQYANKMTYFRDGYRGTKNICNHFVWPAFLPKEIKKTLPWPEGSLEVFAKNIAYKYLKHLEDEKKDKKKNNYYFDHKYYKMIYNELYVRMSEENNNPINGLILNLDGSNTPDSTEARNNDPTSFGFSNEDFYTEPITSALKIYENNRQLDKLTLYNPEEKGPNMIKVLNGIDNIIAFLKLYKDIKGKYLDKINEEYLSAKEIKFKWNELEKSGFISLAEDNALELIKHKELLISRYYNNYPSVEGGYVKLFNSKDKEKKYQIRVNRVQYPGDPYNPYVVVNQMIDNFKQATNDVLGEDRQNAPEDLKEKQNLEKFLNLILDFAREKGGVGTAGYKKWQKYCTGDKAKFGEKIYFDLASLISAFYQQYNQDVKILTGREKEKGKKINFVGARLCRTPHCLDDVFVKEAVRGK